jgi:hypothetical protein
LIHPHVEGSITQIAETTVGFVELERRNSKVKKNALRCNAASVLVKNIPNFVIAGVDEGDSVSKVRKARACDGECVTVTVNSNQADAVEAVKE